MLPEGVKKERQNSAAPHQPLDCTRLYKLHEFSVNRQFEMTAACRQLSVDKSLYLVVYATAVARTYSAPDQELLASRGFCSLPVETADRQYDHSIHWYR
jgi:hypothetical protein